MRLGQIWGPLALAVVLSTTPAKAEVAEFYGVWSNGTADASGIARIVVSPGNGARATIHLFGRCRPADCDWGEKDARTYADDPGSKEIRSLVADFDTAGAHRRIVLRSAIGHALRFEVQTDFYDGRQAFATTGVVAYAGDWNTAPRAASAPTLVATAPANPSVAETLVPEPTPQQAPSSGGWFSGPSLIGTGPSIASGYVPAAGEDCRPFNPDQVRAGYVEDQWRVGDFANRLLTFGPHQSAARLSLAILGYYHFDEECFVGHDTSAMLYWKRAGQVPNAGMHGEDCVAFTGVKVVPGGDGWRVTAGDAVLLEYDEKSDAERAASVIATYRLNRQCFFSAAESRAQYWLSQ